MSPTPTEDRAAFDEMLDSLHHALHGLERPARLALLQRHIANHASDAEIEQLAAAIETLRALFARVGADDSEQRPAALASDGRCDACRAGADFPEEPAGAVPSDAWSPEKERQHVELRAALQRRIEQDASLPDDLETLLKQEALALAALSLSALGLEDQALAQQLEQLGRDWSGFRKVLVDRRIATELVVELLSKRN